MIESKNNQQIRNIMKLKKQAKERRKQKVFLVEGIRMFREAPKDKVDKAYVTEKFYEEHEELFEGIRFELVSESVFKEMSDTVTPQGVLAIVKQPTWTLDQMLGQKGPHCFIVLENIQDPGNLGTILRTGEGVGIDGVIMSKDTVDIYNPKVIRSTMGSIYRVPFVYVDDMADMMQQLKEHGVTTYAARLDGSNIYKEDLRTSCAFLIGNEGNGLTEELSSLTQSYIKIPMHGQVESLNAAIASTVLMYETMRQREQ